MQAELVFVRTIFLWQGRVSVCSYPTQRPFWSWWFGCQCWCSWHRRKGGWMQQKLCLICITLNHKSSKRENRREGKCLILDSDLLQISCSAQLTAANLPCHSTGWGCSVPSNRCKGKVCLEFSQHFLRGCFYFCSVGTAEMPAQRSSHHSPWYLWRIHGDSSADTLASFWSTMNSTIILWEELGTSFPVH